MALAAAALAAFLLYRRTRKHEDYPPSAVRPGWALPVDVVSPRIGLNFLRRHAALI